MSSSPKTADGAGRVAAISIPAVQEFFLELVRQRVPTPAADWLAQNLSAGEPLDHDLFAAAFAAAARRLGKATLGTTADQDTELTRLGVTWPLRDWGLDELGRVTLLLAAATRIDDAAFERRAEDCYQHGDVRERQATLRALALLPANERFVALAVD